MRDPLAFLAKTYLALYGLVASSEQRQRELLETMALDANQNAYWRQIRRGYVENNAYLQRLMQTLEPHLRPRQLAEQAHLAQTTEQEHDPHLDFWHYLARDWSGSKAGQEELSVIVPAIVDHISGRLASRDVVVIPGAATGRIAWELQQHFKHVAAFDSSFAMVASFRLLTEEPQTLWQIDQANRATAADVAQSFKALVPERTASVGELSFSVADALAIPFPEGKASAFVSVYFTDVLSLPELLQSARRVLAPGGLFVHFGPLDYHPGVPQGARRPADHLREMFDLHGFDFCNDSEQWIPSAHLRVPGRMRRRIYDNWSFVAVRSEETRHLVTHATKLKVAARVFVERSGYVPASSDQDDKIKLHLANGSGFTVGETVLDILAIAEDRRTAGQIIDQLAEDVDFEPEVLWDTASEVDNAGFVLWRKGPGDAAVRRVSESLIPAMGVASEGAKYVVVDATADVSGTYFYWLQDIDTRGVSALHGPVVTCVETSSQ